jgi:hypothetical protein
MPRLQRPGANSDLIKNREDRDCTARHVQWRDGLIEQAMEIDELPENDERLLKKPEIKRDEMARLSSMVHRIQPGGAKLAKCKEKAS